MLMICVKIIAPATPPEVHCDYKDDQLQGDRITQCNVTNVNIYKDNTTVTFKTPKPTAKGFRCEYQDMYFIPNGIDKAFPDLWYITIRHSNMMAVSSRNLQPFSKITYLDLSWNQLQYLPENLFKHNKNLTTLWLNDNRIILIHETAFSALTCYNFLNLNNNRCYSVMYQHQNCTNKISQDSSKCPQNQTLTFNIVQNVNLTEIDGAIKGMLSNISEEFKKVNTVLRDKMIATENKIKEKISESSSNIQNNSAWVEYFHRNLSLEINQVKNNIKEVIKGQKIRNDQDKSTNVIQELIKEQQKMSLAMNNLESSVQFTLPTLLVVLLLVVIFIQLGTAFCKRSTNVEEARTDEPYMELNNVEISRESRTYELPEEIRPKPSTEEVQLEEMYADLGDFRKNFIPQDQNQDLYAEVRKN